MCRLLQAEGLDMWDFIYDILRAKKYFYMSYFTCIIFELCSCSVSQNDVSARKARVTSEIESLRNAVVLLESDLRHSQEATSKLGQSLLY